MLRRDPERLLALLIRAQKIDALDRDVSRYFRAGYRVGRLNAIIEMREGHGEEGSFLEGESARSLGEDG